jgi:ferrochelatase
LQTRPKIRAYAKVWTDEGSPLIVLSKECMLKLKLGCSRFISYALWKPFSLSGLQELHDQGVTEVMLFPLYPQHAMASTTTY